MRSQAQRRQYGEPVDAAAPEYSLRAKAHPLNRSRVREHQVLAVAYSHSAGACPASILAPKSRASNSERSTHKGVEPDGRQRTLCSLADALLVWSPPDPGAGCILPFAMSDCSRNGLFSDDRRPVFRFSYAGAAQAGWGYPKNSCGARGIWLSRPDGPMPPGASIYIEISLERMKPREVTFTMTLGADGGTFGCGEFRGLARFAKGQWKVVGMNGGRPIRKRDNPACRYTKEHVLGRHGGLTSR
jgi:hypothetical protein